MRRWSLDKKTTVEESKTLSLPWLKKYGYLNPGYHSGNIQWKNWAGEVVSSIGVESRIWSQDHQIGDFIRLFYTRTDHATDAKTDMDYRVALATTPCHYGKARYWFICPLMKGGQPCQRRAAKLYLPSGAAYFGCRVCYDLTYQSAQEHDSRVDRLLKNPELLSSLLDGKGGGSTILTLKAASKMMTKFL